MAQPTDKDFNNLSKALENLTGTLGKTNLSGGGTTSKTEETEKKMNKVLEKRLKDNKAYNDILKKINENEKKTLKISTENEKLEKQKLKYIQKQTELEKLQAGRYATLTRSQLVAHDKMIKTAEIAMKSEANKYKLLEKEVKLETAKNKIISDTEAANSKAIARQEKVDKFKEKVETKFNNIKKATGKFLLNQAKDGLDMLLESDSAISKMSANYSLSKRESGELKKNIGEIAWKSQLIGLSTSDLVALQTSYGNQLGRSVMLSKEGMTSMGQTSVALGLGVEATGQMAADMDLFNIGVRDSMGEMQQLVDISKASGVSATIAAKKFESTLKLSNTYNFRNGVVGVRDMSIYATKMGIKMEQVAAFADKVSSPEASLKTAAALQVLGGSYSQIADPLQLMNQGITDMEGLTKTYSKMLDGVVSIDKVTGKMNENGYEKIRAKAAAEAAGLSFEDMMTAARTKAKRGAVSQELTLNTNIKTDEQKDLIASLATFEKGKGYTVNVKGEQKSITKLQKSDLEYLKPDKVQIKDIAENTLGIKEILDNGLKALLSAITGQLLPVVNEIARVLLKVFGWLTPKVEGGIAGAKNIAGSQSGSLGGSTISGIGGMLSTLGGMKYGSGATKLTLSGKAMEGLMKGGQIGARGIGSKLPFLGAALSGFGEYNDSGSVGRGVGAAGGSLLGGIGGTALAGLLTAGMLSGVGTIPSLLIAAALAGGGAYAGSKAGAWAGGLTDSINDGFISKAGKVTKINDNDSVIALQPGGPLDKVGISPSLNQGIFKGVSPSYGGSGNYSNNSSNNNQPFKLNVSGTINLNMNGNSTSVDASLLLKNPQFIRQLSRSLSASINKDSNGGKYSGGLSNDSF